MPDVRLIDANALRGRFIEGDGHDDDRFTEGFNFATQVYREYKFCANCGARMEESDGAN